MADKMQHGEWPLWVRSVIRRGLRGVALFQIGFSLIITVLGLLQLGGRASGIESLQGPRVLVGSLVMVCAGFITAVWTWLAVRWIDRNGKWA